MTSRSTPASGRSIFRGYASAGLGDGPGRPISRGEQFLAAEAPFAEDGELLSGLRPWMTLDLDAGDHRRLGDRLEAWSSFTDRDWTVVVRLTPAGTFDHRAAYFSHARAFPADTVAGAADPGALLGRSDAFEAPWQDGRRGEGTPSPAPAMVRPEQVAAEPEAAAALLAHLLQALLARRPVVVAVPVEELVEGAPLHALVSFARAALPPRLKRSCRVRVYARSPDLFLGRLGCHLLVVPESVASDALAARRDAVLLDRRARRHAGSEPDPGVEAWARKVALWACERPGALLEFAARYGDRVWDGADGPPGEREVVSVAVTYRLSEELAGGGEPARNLLGQLRNASARLEPGTIPWGRLLGAEEWGRFSRREVLELVLAAPDGLPPGVRELQEAATEAAVELGWSAVELVAGGGAPAEGGALGRLLDLSARAPGLVPAGAVRRRLLEVPLRRLAELGLLARVLETEDGLEAVAAKADELAELPELLEDGTVRELVLEATLAGRLDPGVLEGMAKGSGTAVNGGRWLGERLRDLSTDRLLRLAGPVAPGGPLERAAAEVLSDRMRRDPAETGAHLLRRGAWSWWRRLAPAHPPEAGDWALAWLGSPVWDEPPRVDPRLEDWELVMADLGERLEGREVLALLGNGRRAWPWIPLFADRQVADLARRMPDLGTVALLVARSPEGERLSRPEVEERAFRAFTADRPTLRSLGPGALRWVGESPEPESLPPLSADGGQLLYREAGPCRGRMVENLALWIERGGLAEGSERDLLPWLDRLGAVRRSRPSERARTLARQLAERGHPGTARLLDPELDARQAERDGARRLLDALAAGRLEDAFWKGLQRKVASYRQGGGDTGARHPFRELVDGLSDEPVPSPPGSLWPPFAGLMDRYPGLFAEADRGGEEPLPAFALAAALFEDLGPGTLAVRLGLSAPEELTRRDAWWRSIVAAVDGCRRRTGRRSALDRPDVARALLARARHDLSEPARAALGRVLWLDLDLRDPPGGGP